MYTVHDENEIALKCWNLACTYANEHVCILNYIARVALEGHTTLAKVADATPHIYLQEAALTKKILAKTI